MGILVSILVGIIVGISMGILVGILVGRLVGRQARRGGQSTPEMQRLPHDCIELLGQCKLHRGTTSSATTSCSVSATTSSVLASALCYVPCAKCNVVRSSH